MMSAPEKSYARKLFGTAAAFNFFVALALLLLRPLVMPLIRLDPIAGHESRFPLPRHLSRRGIRLTIPP
jgi:hypothetical protein